MKKYISFFIHKDNLYDFTKVELCKIFSYVFYSYSKTELKKLSKDEVIECIKSYLDKRNEEFKYLDRSDVLDCITSERLDILTEKYSGNMIEETVWDSNGDEVKWIKCFSSKEMMKEMEDETLTILEYKDENTKELNGVKFTFDSNVRQVYCVLYPYDYQRYDIRKDLTFRDVWNGLCDGKDIYKVISEYCVDSEVRERIFEMISILKDCNYIEIWNLWLSKGELPLWIPCRDEKGERICHIPIINLYDN